MWSPGLILAGAWTGFLLLAMVRPTLRARRRWGTLPVSFHRDTLQRLMGALLTGLLLGVPVWSALLAVVGLEAVGGCSPAPAVSGAGWALMAASGAVVVVAQNQMGASWQVGIGEHRTGLVQHGLFRWVRNPIFTGMLGFAAGTVLVAPSPLLAGAALATAALLRLQVREEEAHLLDVHGEAYRSWASRTGRFLPGLGRLPSAGRAS